LDGWNIWGRGWFETFGDGVDLCQKIENWHKSTPSPNVSNQPRPQMFQPSKFPENRPYFHFFLKINVISTIPTIPKTGYNKLTKIEKLIWDKKIARILIIIKFLLYEFLFPLQLLKKLYPVDIAVVKIDIAIIIMYKFLYRFPYFFTISIIGISKLKIVSFPKSNKL